MPTTNRVSIIAVLVGLVIIGLVAAVLLGNRSTTTTPLQPPQGVDQVSTLLAGLPQQGNALGNPNAPVTLVEYGDLKCPICKSFAAETLPQLITNYIKPGKVRMVYQPQDFVGDQTAPGDSERAARMALASGLQNKLWDFIDLFYINQQDETTTYATIDYLKNMGSAISGLDAQKALNNMNSSEVSKELNASITAFNAVHFNGTPSFQIGKTGGTLTNLSVSSLGEAEFKTAIDKLLPAS